MAPSPERFRHPIRRQTTPLTTLTRVNDQALYTVNLTPSITRIHICDSAHCQSRQIGNLNPHTLGHGHRQSTNRCRLIAQTSSTTLLPCDAGEERNPDTNRCRKSPSDVLSSATAGNLASSSADDQAKPKTISSWLVAGFAGTAVIVYGVYEWRSEIWQGMVKLKSGFSVKFK